MGFIALVSFGMMVMSQPSSKCIWKVHNALRLSATTNFAPRL